MNLQENQGQLVGAQHVCNGPTCRDEGGRTLPRDAEHFHRNAKTKDGLQDWCKRCMCSLGRLRKVHDGTVAKGWVKRYVKRSVKLEAVPDVVVLTLTEQEQADQDAYDALVAVHDTTEAAAHAIRRGLKATTWTFPMGGIGLHALTDGWQGWRKGHEAAAFWSR